MKKTIRYILFLLIMVPGMTACGTVSKDSYVEETDYQYQYYNKEACTAFMAHSKDTLYYKSGHYIYKLDETSGTVTPLCNKANCLHDQETDSSRRSECNAYLSSTETGIAYMDGYIYFITLDIKEGGWCQNLYKVAEDGSTRESVYQWEGSVIEGWCIHRNILYYVKHTYDESNNEFYSVNEMKLAGWGNLQEKTIYEPDNDITVYAFGTPQAYGNHIYFSLDGATTNNVGQLSGDNWAEYIYGKCFQYNLQEGSLSEIQIPEQSDTQSVSEVTFWQNHIVYCAFDFEKEHQYDAVVDVYMADLDGTNAAVLLEDMPIYRWYSSDGDYLYISNCPENQDKIFNAEDFDSNVDEREKKHDFEEIVDIYDRNMELVDSVQAPFHTFPTEPVYGIGDRMYIMIDNDSGDGIKLEYWDKTKIGTYQGKEYQLTELCEQPLSKADLQEIEVQSEEE